MTALLLLAVVAAAPEQLLGTWQPLDGEEPEKRLVTYRKDGTGTASGFAFRWKLEGKDRLTVTYDDGSVLLARIAFERGVLVETDLVDTDVRRFRRVKAGR